MAGLFYKIFKNLDSLNFYMYKKHVQDSRVYSLIMRDYSLIMFWIHYFLAILHIY